MGKRSLIFAVLAGCGHPAPQAPQPAGMPASPQRLQDHVVADFERAVLANKDAYVSLFDFVAVGEYEILLHRYDLNGRLAHLEPDQKAQFAGEDGTPYPETRERRNVGNFYPTLAQRTVGTGGCTAQVPRTHYGKLLGTMFDPLPEGTPPGYEKLRTDANQWLAKGGVVAIKCSGGKGGLAVVYTERASARGYDLITIYDD
ncbi:MAG: hypothetical protein JWO36_3975 [Myxococcales bacterium]|nr:hypothetical protein [Myxococcales bacterium]